MAGPSSRCRNRPVPATKKSRPHSIIAITPRPPRSSTQSNRPQRPPISRATPARCPPRPRPPSPAQPSMSSSSSLKPATIVAISVGTVVTGLAAYAVYFDHKRRNDPEFRKQLKRESKRSARAAKDEAEAHGKEQKKAIREAVASANEEGFPKDPEEIEAYFMQEVAQGEGMVQSGMCRRMANVVTLFANPCHRRRPRRGRAVLLPRPQGLPQPQRAHQHLRQDRAQGRSPFPIPFCDCLANAPSPCSTSSPR